MFGFHRCVSYGVLPWDEASRLNNVILKRKGKKGNLSSQTPTKGSKKRVKVDKDVEVEADLQISGAEFVGSSTML
jgi:hypothetical protein